jgi:oligopeptide/dipeptide ABC transporter ATP-binding protein
MSALSSAAPVLEVADLKKHFPVEKGVLRRVVAHVKAVDGVSFAIRPGETLCLVGESGCGKSTVGKLALGLIPATAGSIRLHGADITGLSRTAMQPHRKRIQMVFQDPSASLNPRLTAGAVVSEPMENFGDMSVSERQDRTVALLGKVGLGADAMRKYPFEFSGGQKQRLGIARALALNPSVIVADEPVSALDVSVQAQVLNLMMDLQEEFGLAYLFVSHDLGVVEHIGHRIAVMYLGRIVEVADRDAMFANPRHPYTRALISAAPMPDPRARREKLVIEGDVPSPQNPPPGCHFHTRCPFAVARCKVDAPALRQLKDGRLAACHLEE